MKILNRGQASQSAIGLWWKKVQDRLMGSFTEKKIEFIKQSRVSENRHIVIITAFFTGAVYISWLIEDKYDRMRDRAKNTKSLKTRQV
jgi:hypothetical protein